VRLNKLMRDRELCSRREADEYISAGRVRVDGVVAGLGVLVNTSAHVLIAAAKGPAERPLTIAVHKPRSFISQAANPRPGQRFAWQLLTWANQSPLCAYGRHDDSALEPLHIYKLGCCGRLDQDSSGLLVFSQDGRVARRMVGEADGESGDVRKYYEIDVRFRDRSAAQDVPRRLEAVAARLRHGLVLDGEVLRPAEVEWAAAVPKTAYWDHWDVHRSSSGQRRQPPGQPLHSSGGGSSSDDSRGGSGLRTLHMTLRQGKYRQIRRMCELVGLEVTRLVRVGVGGLSLAAHHSPAGLGLRRPGEWRVLDDEQLVLLATNRLPLP
jgi:23S rRNA pseudouridine2604 synthase